MESPTAAAADAGDCLAAIALGLRAIEEQSPGGGPFRLTGANNLLKGAGAQVWELRFKPLRLLPIDAAGEIGAGGEIKVRVDLNDAAAPPRITRED